MSVLAKLKKNSRMKDSSVLSESQFFSKETITTPVPALNIALSGDPEGGFQSGLTIMAGPSKHFKTAFSLLMARSYMKKHKDAVILFYDSEFGSPQSYFDSFGIDTSRVLHTPIKNVEELKQDLANQLANLERGDKVIIVIDSVGNLASLKEIEDAQDQKTTVDMTRAKQLKSVFRIATPYLTSLDIPMVVVNHTYKELSMFPKDIVSGGTGPYYSADNIFIIGRQQEKDTGGKKELLGYNFVIKVEKSRHVVEGSKIPIRVLFDGGISKWSGLIDIALDGLFLHKTKKGRQTAYAYISTETGEVLEDEVYTEKETENADFWRPILMNPKFKEYVANKYKISHGSIITDDEVEEFIDGEE